MNDYIHHLYSPGKWVPAGFNFINGLSLTAAQGFVSLYGVDKATADAIVAENTPRQFKGVVWSERLWVDIDSYEQAERVEETLKRMELDFVAYDSGGKGAHFGILRTHPPSHLLPQKDRSWVKAVLPQADTSIYSHMHLFRIAGTVHERTGRRKELVSTSQGRALLLPPLLEQRDYSFSPGDVESIFDMYRVMANTVPAINGERHHTLVRLAYALKDDAKVNSDTALWWLLETNKLFDEPKNDEEVLKILRSIYV